jgi:His-Xaa-Ser system protein HxsD
MLDSGPMAQEQADGFPADLCTVTEEAAAVTVHVDSSLYPLGALYGAAYIFIDRCFVMLGRPDETHYSATLAWKKGAPPDGALRELAGEFLNELLSCAWRAKINEESRSIIEAVTAQAFAGAMGPPSLDDLEKFDFSEEAFDDPLGIAMSWEDKYGKKKAAAAKGEAAPNAVTTETSTADAESVISATAPTEPEAH